MIDRDAFEAWLRAQRYAETTRRNTLASLAATEEALQTGAPLTASLAVVARRLGAYCADTGRPCPEPLGRGLAGLDQRRDAQRRGGRAGRPTKRKKPAHGLSDTEWTALWQAVRDDRTRAARVLEAQMVSGLRVSDVLGITREALRRGLEHDQLRFKVKGGAERLLYVSPARETWARLFSVFEGRSASAAHTVADAVCAHSERCAYYAVEREIKRLGRELGIEPLHTHRLRRTVAVQALRATDGDLVAVQQLLGHTSIQSTARYVDEAQPERVAKLSRTLGSKFRGES